MATKPEYEYRPSPNHSGTRRRPVSAVVIHYTASMNIDGTLAWFMNPNSRASAHYLIGRDGKVIQMVPDDLVAWHAGRSSMRPDLSDGDPSKEPNVNQFSIGIELVGTADSGFTDTQMASLYSLLEVLCTRYRIPPERVVGHCHVAPGRKIDPDGFGGQFSWRRTREVVARAYATVRPVPPEGVPS